MDALVPFLLGRLVPTGAVIPYAASAAPGGWLTCDGAAVSRTTYAKLFGVVGTTYGTGDGSTTFNVPDMQGRMPVGKGTHVDVDVLGDSDGIATVANRRPKHKHTVVQPTISQPAVNITDSGHVHDFNSFLSGSGLTRNSEQANVSSQVRTGLVASNTTGITAALASAPVATAGTVGDQTGTPPVDAAPWLTLNFLIKT